MLHYLDRALSGIRPLFFLLAYLLLIPCFGLIFTFCSPGGFYAPYARFEPSAVRDASDIAYLLQNALRRAESNDNSLNIIEKTWKLDLTSIAVDDVTGSDDGHLHFRILLAANSLKENTNPQIAWSAELNLPERPIRERLGNPEFAQIYRIPNIIISANSIFSRDNDIILNHILGYRSNEIDSTDQAIILNAIENEKVERFLRGSKGDPTGFSDQLGRMFYLSAVVVTTLGLGDIVPITPGARALVALEAVLGITFAGLFLNSLASSPK